MNAHDARADVDLQAKIWVRLPKDTQVATAFHTYEEHKAGTRLETTIGRIIFNNVFPDDYPFMNYQMNKKEIGRWSRTFATATTSPTFRRSSTV